ncbi:MAG: hypothetical protein LBC98_05075 [Prevotellaceae bacterium]|jgi:hypothetical protein|nr:hypothetical protein [Prevotellaceae bacterium]
MKPYITTAIVVLAALAWLLFSRMEIFNSDRHFAVDEPDAITRIELSSAEKRTVLSKSNNQWRIYDEKANQLAVKTLLRIITDINVEYPMPKVHENQLLELNTDEKSLHILIYEGDNCIRNCHLMFTESSGCIGLIDGSKQVYCLKVPGIDDNSLSECLSPEPLYWLRNQLFDIHPNQILSITLTNNEHREESFSITCSDSAVIITDFNGNQLPMNKDDADKYLSYFMNVSFEKYIDAANLSKEKLQQIIQSEPSHILTLETADGKLSYKATYITEPDKIDEYGQALIYNRNCFYLMLPDGKLAQAKWISFDILFKKPTQSNPY